MRQNMCFPKIGLILGVVTTLFGQSSKALPLPPKISESQRIERLVGLSELWGRVRLLNPDLATKPIDWDKALVEAVKLVNAAKDKEDFTKAVATMLNALGDPTSGLAEPKLPSLVELPEGLSPCTWLDEQTLLLHLNDLLRFQKGIADGAEFNALLRRESAKARRVIFDLRPEKSVNGMDDSDRSYPFLLLKTVLDGLVPTDVLPTSIPRMVRVLG